MAIAEAFGKFAHEVEDLPLHEFYEHWAWLAYKTEEERKHQKQAQARARAQARR